MDQTSEQSKLWNGASGRAWVEAQEVLDQMFTPFEALLVDAVTAGSPRVVLDIGCGTGATTLAVTRRLGSKGSCIGVDISEPMTTLAKLRAEREHLSARFICADAQTYTFEPASVDAIMSRFGVMFFDDPVRAFANLRQAGRDAAQLWFIVWRSAADNPFMTTAERAAAPLLPNLPPRRADAPGQFSFGNADRVRGVLEQSGWVRVDIQPIDVECTLPEKDLRGYLTRLGPVGVALRDADEGTRARVFETVRAAFDPYVHGDDVRFTASCWMVGARAR